jgi:hypothetical protein
MMQLEKNDSYQGLALAMLSKGHERLTALAPGVLTFAPPTAAAAKAGCARRADAACLKACPDTNLVRELHRHRTMRGESGMIPVGYTGELPLEVGLREGDLRASAFRYAADKSDPVGSGSERNGGEDGFSPSFQEPSARVLRTNA